MLRLWRILFHPGLGSLFGTALYRLRSLGRRLFDIIFLILGAAFGVFQVIKIFVGLLFQGFRLVEGYDLVLLFLRLVILECLVDVSLVPFLDFDRHSGPVLSILL